MSKFGFVKNNVTTVKNNYMGPPRENIGVRLKEHIIL